MKRTVYREILHGTNTVVAIWKVFGVELGPVSLEKREVNNIREIVAALRRRQLVKKDEIEMTQFGGYKRLGGKTHLKALQVLWGKLT